MSPLSRRFLATAAFFLATGLAMGFWMLVRRELLGVWPAPHLVSAHAHLVLVGAVMETILGVAIWLFPRPARGDTRYRPWLAEAAWWLITSGTVLRAVSESARAWSTAMPLRWLVVIGGGLQLLGLLAGITYLRPRIRGVGAGLRAIAS
jgi:heme/copper-type cytochrome/quinol oxidase subunit 1